ncbi:sterol desaturase family protein [Foetidibacter luteolus]|uniref:sterol desaturase family protein n=1 Tax=Foetidibacter luteolus TaxID=2608880 RepID=UPI00129B3E8A|nr:sterol desaturase family protein [Foetidibacter luteolus]
MQINILAFAVPLFISLMVLEYLVAKKKKLDYFSLHNSIANISIGIAERICDVLVTGSFYFVYDYLQKNYGLITIKPGIILWIVLLLCTDFIWYWYHRLAHEVNLLWAVHVVHHQSEDFNYTVSARITVMQAVVRTGFWAVLPLLGFPAGMITSMLLIHGIYPFFIHTRLIGKLGILEYILVTPSHHRVHHASNEKYLDKNYGDVFIIWDKLFGTFQKEEEAPVYGLTKPLNTYSFLWQHFHFYIELWLSIKAAKTWKEKISVAFARPEKIDPSLREKAEKIFHIQKNPAAITKPLNNYVIWQMAILLSALFLFILFEHHFDISVKLIFTTAVIITLINCGAIMEQKNWVFYLEISRLVVLMLVPFCYHYSYAGTATLLFLSAIAMVLIAAYHKSLQQRYLDIVYQQR